MTNKLPTITKFATSKTATYEVTLEVTLQKKFNVRAIDKRESCWLLANRLSNKHETFDKRGYALTNWNILDSREL